jgi:raffinose/stachyose/melibiose transport system substrate-binding protein
VIKHIFNTLVKGGKVMKLSKKVILVSLFAIMALGLVFAGGGKDTAKSSQVVLKVMGYGDNSNQEGQNFVRIVSAFEAANPGVKVDYELLFDEAYHNKVKARIAAGDVPHVAYMGSDARWGGPWQEAGIQIDHNKYIDTNLFDLSTIPADTKDGKRVYLPLGTSNLCTVVFANTKLLKELGFGLPKTYADMVAMVPAAKAKGIEVFSTHGADGWAWGSCIMSSFVARTTGMTDFPERLVKGEIKFTDPTAVAALDFLTTMVADGVLSPNSVMIDSGTGLSNFSNGKALFYMTGQWDAGSISPETQEVTALIAFPALPGEKGTAGSVAAAKQSGYGMTKAAETDGVTDAAMKFLNYFYGAEETIQRVRDGAIVAPVIKVGLPSDLPTIVKAKAAFGGSGMIETQVIDSYLTGAPNDALNAGMQEIVAGKTTGKDLAAKVEGLLRK